MTDHDRLFELARRRQDDTPYLLIAAGCEIVCHAKEALRCSGAPQPLLESQSITASVRDWLENKDISNSKKAYTQVIAPVRTLASQNAGRRTLNGGVWPHYLACTHLSLMLHEYTSGRADNILAQRLQWVATNAANCVAQVLTAPADKAYRRVRNAEAAWQIECLESLALRYAPPGAGERTRNSLLTT